MRDVVIVDMQEDHKQYKLRVEEEHKTSGEKVVAQFKLQVKQLENEIIDLKEKEQELIKTKTEFKQLKEQQIKVEQENILFKKSVSDLEAKLLK